MNLSQIDQMQALTLCQKKIGTANARRWLGLQIPTHLKTKPWISHFKLVEIVIKTFEYILFRNTNIHIIQSHPIISNLWSFSLDHRRRRIWDIWNHWDVGYIGCCRTLFWCQCLPQTPSDPLLLHRTVSLLSICRTKAEEDDAARSQCDWQHCLCQHLTQTPRAFSRLWLGKWRNSRMIVPFAQPRSPEERQPFSGCEQRPPMPSCTEPQKRFKIFSLTKKTKMQLKHQSESEKTSWKFPARSYSERLCYLWVAGPKQLHFALPPGGWKSCEARAALKITDHKAENRRGKFLVKIQSTNCFDCFRCFWTWGKQSRQPCDAAPVACAMFNTEALHMDEAWMVQRIYGWKITREPYLRDQSNFTKKYSQLYTSLH